MNSSTRCDLFVLAPLGVAQPLEARVALLQVLRVVGVVVGDRPQRQVGDARHHGVEEVAIVRDEDHRVRVGDEVLLEPVARLEVEMVGRLVEQQQVRRAQQQLRQRETHLPAARQVIGQLLLHLRLEAEPAQHRRDLELDLIAVAQAEAILHLAVAREHRLVLRFGQRRIAEPLLERVHLGLQIEQGLEREAGLVHDGASADGRGRPAGDSRA